MMPPKSDSAQHKPNDPSPSTKPKSKSKSVVKVGSKHLSAKYQGIKNDKGERPTTSRALTLRHGKYGSFGTGEMMHLGKMTGREKLDLLAEDLTDKAKKAVAAPFSLEKCLEIAESQCNAYLDDIRSLHDPELFYSLMQAEITARSPPSSVSKPSTASLVISRIHNSYMLASAWRLILYSLIDLGEMGLADVTSSGVKGLLKSNIRIRERFLVLYDLVQVLVGITQKQFATIAAVTPPYVHYFKHKKEKARSTDPDDDDVVVFDWAGLKIKDACKSFIDSIVIELCFPEGPYPTGVLFQLLHDAVEEAPHHAKRFPQALWDSVGDLAISVELLDLMESPLLTSEASGWRNSRRSKPATYDEWLDAQRYSLEATTDTSNWKDLVSPLEKTKTPHILESMWKTINANYMSVSGKSLNALWQLDEALIPNPQWHAIYIPSDVLPDDDEDEEDDDDMPALSKRSKKKPLRLTNGDDDGSGYESMPVLLSVSDDESSSSDDGASSSSLSDDAFSDYDDESDEGEYDTDAEDDLREQLKEAMNQAHQYDFYESIRVDERPPFVVVEDADADAEEKERKDKNPFLKLLGSLRGRMFTSSPKLKVPVGKGTSATRGVSTVEDEDGESADEGASVTAVKKKKKKPKKKKKKKSAAAALVGVGVGEGDGDGYSGAEDEEEEEVKGVAEKQKVAVPAASASVRSPVASSAIPTIPSPISTGGVPPTSPSKKKKKRSSSTSTPLSPTSPTSPTSTHSHTTLPGSITPTPTGYGSTTSLPLPLPQVEKAQSSHSYLKEVFGKGKTKMKTRAGVGAGVGVGVGAGAGDGGLGVIDEKEKEKEGEREGKKGLFARWRLGKEGKDKDKDKDKDGVKEKEKEKEGNPFSKLSKRAKEHLRVLLKTESKGTLRWEQFLKIMSELGFEINPSTAGSSVRFTPPNDRSITFHKPHPDSTLQPHHITAFGARLRDHYGWSKEKLEKSFYAQADEEVARG